MTKRRLRALRPATAIKWRPSLAKGDRCRESTLQVGGAQTRVERSEGSDTAGRQQREPTTPRGHAGPGRAALAAPEAITTSAIPYVMTSPIPYLIMKENTSMASSAPTLRPSVGRVAASLILAASILIG